MKQQNLLRQASLKQAQIAGLAFLLVSGVVLSSCAGTAKAPVAGPNPTDPTDVPVPIEAPPVGNTALPTSVETSVFQDIASTSNVPVESIQVISYRPEAWPDGCLGLGGPDEICTFAIVDGWEVTASNGEEQWVYRTDLEGSVVRTTGSAEIGAAETAE